MEFPTNVSEFKEDGRIFHDNGVYHLIDDKKGEWEFDVTSETWKKLDYLDDVTSNMEDQEFVPGITDENIAQFQQNFTRPDNDDDGAVRTHSGTKRKAPADSNGANEKKPKVQENRAIFVSNLPSDTTLSELEEFFSKFGMIDTGVGGNKRIYMYNDDEGNFKGEALIVFFRKESVITAIQIADGDYLRFGTETMTVKEADMSYKKNTDTDVVKSKMNRQERKDKERRAAEMNRKLTEWDSDDEELMEAKAASRMKPKHFVIIKNAFTLEELDADVRAIYDTKEEFLEVGAEYGSITKVEVWDREPAGIVSVRFKEPDAAEKFAEAANGMPFGDRNGATAFLTAYATADRPKFKKSGQGTASDHEEELARLENFVNADAS